jgi:hypothetical protein
MMQESVLRDEEISQNVRSFNPEDFGVADTPG